MFWFVYLLTKTLLSFISLFFGTKCVSPSLATTPTADFKIFSSLSLAFSNYVWCTVLCRVFPSFALDSLSFLDLWVGFYQMEKNFSLIYLNILTLLSTFPFLIFQLRIFRTTWYCFTGYWCFFWGGRGEMVFLPLCASL